MFLQQVLCASPANQRKRTNSLFEGLRATLSVAGPSIGFVIQVNLCVLFTALFFVGTWLAFLATTFGVFLLAALLASRQVLALGLFTTIALAVALAMARKSSVLRHVHGKLIVVLDQLQLASKRNC